VDFEGLEREESTTQGASRGKPDHPSAETGLAKASPANHPPHMPERDTLKREVYGTGAHVHILKALEGLDARQAGTVPHNLPHSIYQLVSHMNFWLDIGLKRIRGERPPRPASAALGWTAPPRPEPDDAWTEALDDLKASLWELEAILEDPSIDLDRISEPSRGRTVRDNVVMLLLHNSHHLGQIVQTRQLLGAWPPPGGGDTW
jgi:uncharacterized damage-inducible protein DinB